MSEVLSVEDIESGWKRGRYSENQPAERAIGFLLKIARPSELSEAVEKKWYEQGPFKLEWAQASQYWIVGPSSRTPEMLEEGQAKKICLWLNLAFRDGRLAPPPAPQEAKPCQCGQPILRWVHQQPPKECGKP